MDFRDAQSRRLAQANERQRRVRRYRFGALASLVAVVAVLVAIVSSSTGGSSSSPHKSSSKKSTRTTASPAAAKPGTASVPILTYYVINSAPPGSSAPADLYVARDEFAGQMNALKAAGWHAVTLDQLQAYRAHGKSLGPGKPIVISFDNGYASQYTNALPVLRRLGWAAVANIEVNGPSPAQGGMTDSQIRGLISAGWELDSEGVTHTDLISVGSAQLQQETATARQTLHSRYNVPVNWFCYPLGHYNAAVIAAVRSAGYSGAQTIVPGWTSPHSDRFRLPRLQVATGTSPSTLLSQIAAAQSDGPPPASSSLPGIA